MISLYLVVGIAMGVIFGYANDDMTTYVSTGAALGLILGYFRAGRAR